MDMNDDGVVVQANGTTLLAKLCFAKAARLAEVGDTMGSLRDKFGEFYGPEAATGELTYKLSAGDADELQLVTDDDVKLANRVGAKPLRVTSVAKVVPPEADERSVFEHAEAALAVNGLEAPADQVRRLLSVLDFRPRRLVKCGLAPPAALRHTAGADDAKDDDEEEDEDEEAPFEVVEPMGAVSIQDKDQGLPVAEEVKPLEDDAVVAALAGRGVRLAPEVTHALLRILHVAPKRFVKKGLVGDLKAARQAYRQGGKASAKALFKKGGCKGGYGRGLHGRGPGGCGRGRGWGFGKGGGGCHGGKGDGHGPRKKGRWDGATSGKWGDDLVGGHWNSTWGGPAGAHSWGASWTGGRTNSWGAPPPGVPHEPLDEAQAAPPPPQWHPGKGGHPWGPPPGHHWGRHGRHGGCHGWGPESGPRKW